MSILLLAVMATLQEPQSTPTTPPEADPQIGSQSQPDRPSAGQQNDDIVVEGYRKRGKAQTKSSAPKTGATTDRRQTYALAERLAKCAVTSRPSSLRWLRATVDGEINSAPQRYAQDHLVRLHITCSESPWLATMTSPPRERNVSLNGDFVGTPAGIRDVAPLGHSIFDRGAFTIQTIKRYAPGLKLSRTHTSDPVVQARFNAREIPRNRFRAPADYEYFAISACIVRVEPELSMRLAKSDGPARRDDLQAALIDNARACVGNAREVVADPTEFRLYIADAVYRWAVAANGIDSLIPS